MRTHQGIKKILLGIKLNISLRNYTTFKIGGPARYFFIAKNKNDLIEAVKWTIDKKLPFFILGGGSNVLFSDKGFSGLVIKLQISNFRFQDSELYAEAGAELAELVKLAAEKGLAGIEWIAGIPKITVGGAVRNNAGAFGVTIKDVVKTVEVFDIGDSKIKRFKSRDCKFNYKQTIFKQNKNLIILSCLLRLKKEDKKEVKKKIKHFLKYREENHPMEFPSAGCIFENPKKINPSIKLRSSTPRLRLEEVNAERSRSIKAAELIENCGLKSKRIGGAEVSPKHPNFIVNLGSATSEDILKLINLIKKRVKEKFGITLKEEIQYLGF